jgi:hypothetical protein
MTSSSETEFIELGLGRATVGIAGLPLSVEP